MNKDQKIQAIREACILANEDILKLEFGCEIKSPTSRRIKKRFFTGSSDEQQENYYIDIDQVGSNDEQFLCEQMEDDLDDIIIGRPIRLADVLLAIGQGASYYGPYDGELAMTTSQPERKATWNLLKDSLEDQEEPTINFIHELLQK